MELLPSQLTSQLVLNMFCLNCNVIQRECQTLINALTLFQKTREILHDFVLAKRCQNVDWSLENCGYVSLKMLEIK